MDPGHISRNCLERTKRFNLRRLDEDGLLDWDEMRRMVQEKDAKAAQSAAATNGQSFPAPQ
ncbi:hypothetical protein AURDEDRAFT_170215 [Auricularia subglabra TFB-10046 SS5]|nr:hypothetical protein AURDEDRAFT_170215 [Auricularia subglabra TFB-10046 SS5]